ncbi:putative Methyltransferase family protein [Hibiscus syriacus]|uniref:Methyltransferase family protein n=1 Tax=Hibiscus syriacus TaxID=106335 RepID=A0A6A3BF87_HIBSY|nr:putative Methyltransferase family protein [Hibiscus syriacus]
MGCSQSKIENEEAVSRCKERKQFMKEAVAARNAFAAAHSAYAMSLKNTGAALSDYAHGEVQNPNLPSHPGPSFVGSPVDKLLPPPPPPVNLSGDPGVPIQRSASMPIQMSLKGKQMETSTSTIMEDEEEEDDDVEASGSLVKRRSRNYKGSGSGGWRRRELKEEEEEVEEEMVASTMVHARAMQSQPPQDSTFLYFFPTADSAPGPSLGVVEEMRVEDNREVERKVFEEIPRRVEEEEVVEENMREEEMVMEKGQKMAVEVEKPVPTAAGVGKVSKKGGKVGIGSTLEKSSGKGSFNLLQLFTELDDHFMKASESAHEVSKMLEATRLHYHSNFADNRDRGHINHSARVMRVITWNRSFRGLLDNADNGNDDFDSEENETHATVLDKMLAWEKSSMMK